MHQLAFVSLACGTALGLGLATSTVQAGDSDISTIVSGYGTIAGTMTDKSSAEYMSNLQQFKGATNELDIGGESRFGLQGVVNFGPKFSFTAQVLASRAGNKDFDIATEWLFGQYTPTPGLDLRLGRVVMPTFLLSDTRNVGYASTWLRAPNEVYSLMPFKTMDGAQLLWRKSVGPAVVSTQLSYGKSETTIDTPLGVFDVQAQNIISMAFGVEIGDWTVRASQSRMDSPTSLSPTINYSNHDRFLSLGAQYDNGTAVVMSEWTRRTQGDVPGLGIPLIASTSWYVAAGWRIDKFTPMVRYAIAKADGSLVTYPTKPSVGLMLRYDAMRNVALKVQVDRYDASNSNAFKVPQATPGTKVDVLTVGADFVF